MVSVGLAARTTAPVPVFAVAATPLIDNEFPEPAVSNVLFVSVSVVALPTNVSVAAGRVTVPEAAAEACRTVLPLEDPGIVIFGEQAGQVSVVAAIAFVPS